MRVVVVGPALPFKGGGARHTTELANRLDAAGHEVAVESWRKQYPAQFFPPGRARLAELREGDPFRETRRSLAWRRPDSWFRAGRRLAGSDAVVLALLAPMQIPTYLGIISGLRSATRRGGTPRIIVICHGVLPRERRAGDLLLTSALLRQADGILTHTRELADAARRFAARTPIEVAALPPHLPGVRHMPAGSPGRTGPRLLFFGNVRRYKGLDILLLALARTPPHLTLTVAGEFWNGTSSTTALITRLGLDDRVEIRPGYVHADGIPALMAAADALVLPYRTSTASQNALLGRFYGLPVIATRTGNFPQQVRDGVDGLLCEPADVADLARTLIRFSQPGTAARLRSAVRPADGAQYWRDYLDALLRLAAA